MPVQTRPTLKSWFERLDKPTQEQFWDWMDSYFHIGDTIPQANVEGLTAVIAGLPTPEQLAIVDSLAPSLLIIGGAGTYQLPAGKILQYIVCEANADGICQIGTSSGQSQLVEANLQSDVPQTFTFNQYSKNSITLHFTGNFSALIFIR
jgi:hypothetical protein